MYFPSQNIKWTLSQEGHNVNKQQTALTFPTSRQQYYLKPYYVYDMVCSSNLGGIYNLHNGGYSNIHTTTFCIMSRGNVYLMTNYKHGFT